MQLKWNARKAQVELIHNDGRTVCVPESKLVAIDGSMAALVAQARHTPSVAINVPSSSNARGLNRRVYVNSLTTV